MNVKIFFCTTFKFRFKIKNIFCFQGNLEIVERLVEAKADLGAVDSRRRTPLLLAARDGQAAVARYMIMNGADIHHVSVDGRSAMHMAASRGQNRIVQMLMDSEKDEVGDKS